MIKTNVPTTMSAIAALGSLVFLIAPVPIEDGDSPVGTATGLRVDDGADVDVEVDVDSTGSVVGVEVGVGVGETTWSEVSDVEVLATDEPSVTESVVDVASATDELSVVEVGGSVDVSEVVLVTVTIVVIVIAPVKVNPWSSV